MALSISESAASPLWTRQEVAASRTRLPEVYQKLRGESQPQQTQFHKSAFARKYRDVAYIRKDIISKLLAHSELTQNRLMSYCGLNAVKHRLIVQQLIDCGLITMREEFQGNKRLLVYGCSEKGMRFCQQILEPYEDLFPRNEPTFKASSFRDASPTGAKMNCSLAENLVRLHS